MTDTTMTDTTNTENVTKNYKKWRTSIKSNVSKKTRKAGRLKKLKIRRQNTLMRRRRLRLKKKEEEPTQNKSSSYFEISNILAKLGFN